MSPALRMNRFLACVVALTLATSVRAQPPTGFDAHSRAISDAPVASASGPTGAQDTLRLLQPPRLHSVTDTSANIEWMASLPATCELAWGSTPECENRVLFDFITFGSFSLTQLQPATTYYFQLRKIKLPEAPGQRGAATLPISEPPLKFTTLAVAPAAQTYYVTPDGDDQRSGLAPGQAWRTLQRAADQVNAGDTVHIAAGRYRESVRLRATGTPERPITFRGVPGQKAIIDGDDKALHQGFVVAAKSHLRFDGLYFAGHNRFRLPREFYWNPERPGDFNLYFGRDIVITRCLTDVDGKISAPFILGWMIDQLVVRNCVILSKMSGIDLYDCPDLRLEHNVFVTPQISAFDLQNRDYVLKEKMALKAHVAHNIFTDNLDKKAILGINIYGHSNNAVIWDRNCFFLRQVRTAAGSMTLEQFQSLHQATGSVFVDPQFAGVQPLVNAMEQALKDGSKPSGTLGRLVEAVRRDAQPGGQKPLWWHPADILMNPVYDLPRDFPTYFTTDPLLRASGIGLQEQVFAQD